MARKIGDVKYDEGFVTNSRGLKLFACEWVPPKQEIKGLIFLCHGYAMECSITMNSTAVRLAEAGYAVYGIDYEGHGKSAGLAGYVSSFNAIVEDCSAHFTNICEKEENKGKMRFLMGESMGGGVVLLLHRKKPEYWDGAVLVAPMCRISDDMKPHPIVVKVLTKLSNYIPTWKLLPGQDIIDVAFKVPEVREQIRSNPYCYKGRVRLKTANEILKVSLDLEQRLNEVSLPFIVLHGGDDKVTDKNVSEQLYNVALSTDKMFKLYAGMWHGLLYGEPPSNIDVVFADIIGWLDERVSLGNSRLEREQKHRNDDSSSK